MSFHSRYIGPGDLHRFVLQNLAAKPSSRLHYRAAVSSISRAQGQIRPRLACAHADADRARPLHRGRRIRAPLPKSVVYQERHAIVTNTLARDFSDCLELVPSSTGLHIAALARKTSVEQIAAIQPQAIEAGVAIQILSWFAAKPVERAGIVLGYGGVATDRIEEGLRRLRRCFLN